MKKTILILLLLISVVSFGQIPLGNGYTKSSLRYTYRAFGADSGFHVPYYLGTPSGVRTGVWNGSGNLGVDSTNGRFYFRNNNAWTRVANYSELTGGSVTSVGLTMPSAFSVAGSPVTTSGTLAVTGAGTTLQYIRGDGSLATYGLEYSQDPNQWLALPAKNNPVAGDFWFSSGERSNYHPSPVYISDSLILLATKGDNCGCIRLQQSLDGGVTFDTLKTIITPTVSTFYSNSASMPYLHYDATTDSLHLYFQGISGEAPPVSPDIGYARTSLSNKLNWTIKSNPALRNEDFVTQTGQTYPPGYISLESINKINDSLRFYGTAWEGNGDHLELHDRVFMSTNINKWDTLLLSRIKITASSPDSAVWGASVFKEDTGYYLITSAHTGNFVDSASAMYLRTYYSADGLTGWTRMPGYLYQPSRDSADWDGKRVNVPQIMKYGTGDYSTAVKIPTQDSTFGYPYQDQTTGFYQLYYSGSNFAISGDVNDLTGLLRMYPQTSTQTVSWSDWGNDLTVMNRNTTSVINLPYATDSTAGRLKAADWTTFNNKAPGSGSANYIHNSTSSQTGDFNITGTGNIGTSLNVGTPNFSLAALDVGGDYPMKLGYTAKNILFDFSGSPAIQFNADGGSDLSTLSGGKNLTWTNNQLYLRQNPSPFAYWVMFDGANARFGVDGLGGTAAPDSAATVIGGLRVSRGVRFHGLPTAVGTKAVRIDANGVLSVADTTIPTGVDVTLYQQYKDTVSLFTFGGGGAQAGDTTTFSTSTIYGSFFNTGTDTLIITRMDIGLQGTSPNVTVTVYWNDSLNIAAGATKLVDAGNAATNIYTGTSVTSFDNTKIPPGVWVWAKTTTVATKPTYLTISLAGYKKRSY